MYIPRGSNVLTIAALQQHFADLMKHHRSTCPECRINAPCFNFKDVMSAAAAVAQATKENT